MSAKGQFSGFSRPPQHNPAGAELGQYKARRAEIEKSGIPEKTRIATKPGMTLREECIVEDDRTGDRRAVSVRRAVERWREWMRDYQESSAVFTNTETDEQVTAPLENRFMGKRRETLYAQLKDLERGVKEEWGESLTVVMLTFTASTTSGAGDWKRCPGNHLDDLLSTWPLVRRELSRVLEGREYEYARILEPHKSGHGHVHVPVFVRGPVSAGEMEPVMGKHVDACMAASAEAHRVDGEGAAVSIIQGRELESVGSYVAAYIGGWEEDPLEAEVHEQVFNAVLWATNRRRVSFSNGCRDLMTFEAPEQSEKWDLTHFERRGEVYPNNPQRVEEPYLMVLGDEGAGLDPPPDRGGWGESL